MKTKRIWPLLATALLAIWGILVLDSTWVRASQPRGTLKEAVHVSVSGDWLDPATNNGLSISTYLPLYLFHDALIKAMPDGLYTPCLAESWQISPDYRVYDFRLRKGVKFHNGDLMTAEDVVFSFWRYKAAQAKLIHGKTEKVEALGPQHVRIHFREPFPDFFEYLVPGGTTIGWVVPKKYVEKVGEAGFKKAPVGAGPYRFVEFVPGVRFVGEAFEDYWRKVPHIKRIEVHTVSEPATRVAMVRRGEMDLATHMIGLNYDDVKKDPKLRLLHPQSIARLFVYITSQWDPKSPWSDVRVRKAASLAIDRKTLSSIHTPGGPSNGSLGPVGDPVLVDFPADPYDPEGAKKLLSEAGYPRGFHGGTFYPHQGGYWPHGEQIATYWKAVGITMDTVLLDRPAWLANRAGGKMKGAVFIDTAVAPTVGARLSYLFGPHSYGNYPDIKMLWDQYNKAFDSKIRKDLIGRIQTLIHEREMFIFLTSTTSPAAFGPRIKGNPYHIQPNIWFPAPYEDMELTD